MKTIHKQKIKIWTKRYLPAEIVCTLTALVSASATHLLTKNDVLTALAGTWGENIGFYGVMIARDIHSSTKHHKKSGNNYTFMSLFKNLRNIVLEFGPAEAIDSFVSRPFMMYIFPKVTGSIYIGIFLGKIAADIIVYIPVIASYELQQIHKNRKKTKYKNSSS